MKYSLVSREVIADSIEAVTGCQGFDALVTIGGCDKNMPGCLMGMARLNRPSVFVYGGTIMPGCHKQTPTDVLWRHVHRQYHGFGDRGHGHESAQQFGTGRNFQ
jgi:dihydroxyacid dehydratase/phosphogluconate dehydratase